jgi:hypothetical protein
MDAAFDLDASVLAGPTSAPDYAVASEPKAVKVVSKKGTILRYKADRISVSYVMAMLSLHVPIFFFAPTWLAALCLIPLAVGSMFVAPINHHHQHFNTFHSTWLNRIYELALSLQTGISPY